MIDPSIPQHQQAISERTLRQFGLLCLGVLGAWAYWEGFHRERVVWFVGLASLGVLLGLLGLLRPQALRPLFSVLMAITLPIGVVVSNVILAVLFHGVFTPIALIFRLLGRDPLGRRRLPAGYGTYWKPYPATTQPRRYFRQY
jgi:hypothetical protein